MIHRRTLSTFVRESIHAGLQLEALVETPLNPAAVKDAHTDPERWYSVDRSPDTNHVHYQGAETVGGRMMFDRFIDADFR